MHMHVLPGTGHRPQRLQPQHAQLSHCFWMVCGDTELHQAAAVALHMLLY